MFKPVLIVLLGCLVFFAGCTAESDVNDNNPGREFQKFTSVGVLPPADACGNSDSLVTFLFTPVDADGALISPREYVNDMLVEISGSDRNFAWDDIEFDNGFLYPVPDVTCSDDSACTDPFTCVSINPFNVGTARSVCGMAVEVETVQGNVVFDDGASDVKIIAILMDYGETLAGVDEDGNFAPENSTDPRDHRIAAATNFTIKFEQGSFGPDGRICVVSFGGEGRAAVHFAPTIESCMTSNYDSVRAYLQDLSVGEVGASPIWAAILETIEEQLAGASGDRHILLFTDGDDDGSVDESDTFQAALEAAQNNNVAVHVVQLDNQPDGFADVEPVANFRQLTCGTGGSYQYATGPEDLRMFYENLALHVPAHYQIEAQVASVASANIPSGFYRLAVGLEITLANYQHTLQLAGDKTDPVTLQIIDDRIVIWRE